MSDDFDIENAIRSAGHPPSPQSRDQIRTRLEAAVRGESTAQVHRIGDTPGNGHRRLMFTLVGLTAAAAAALGALVIVNRDETVLEETPATDPPVVSTVPAPVTTLPPTTVPTAAADQRPAAMSIEDGSVFGLAPGEAFGSDDPIATVEQALGPADHDSGWGVVDDGCLAGSDTRVLWWGDLSLQFARTEDGTQSLFMWRAGGGGRSTVAGETYEPPAGAKTPIRSREGIDIGTSEDDLVQQFGDRLLRYSDDAQTYQYAPDPIEAWPGLDDEVAPGRSFIIRVVDGEVAGIAMFISAC